MVRNPGQESSPKQNERLGGDENECSEIRLYQTWEADKEKID